MINSPSPFDVYESRFEPTHLAASNARGQLRRHLRDNGVDQELVDDIELTAAELLSNAVEQQPVEPVEVQLTLAEASVYLTVTCQRLGSLPAAVTGPKFPLHDADDDGLPERGRGLGIVQTLADGMWMHAAQSSTSVSCLHKRRD